MLYQFIRRVHLFTGLLLLAYVLLYFLTGYVMIHAKWFGKNEPKTSIRKEPLSHFEAASDEAMSQHLQETFGLRGQRGPVNHRPDGSVRFGFARPGTSFEALVSPDGKQVTITEKDFAFAGIANGLHRLRGYHGGGIYVLWSLLYDLASFSLILFAVTGVFLWYKGTARKWPGLVFLSAGFGFTAAMILYLMFSK